MVFTSLIYRGKVSLVQDKPFTQLINPGKKIGERGGGGGGGGGDK